MRRQTLRDGVAFIDGFIEDFFQGKIYAVAIVACIVIIFVRRSKDGAFNRFFGSYKHLEDLRRQLEAEWSFERRKVYRHPNFPGHRSVRFHRGVLFHRDIEIWFQVGSLARDRPPGVLPMNGVTMMLTVSFLGKVKGTGWFTANRPDPNTWQDDKNGFIRRVSAVKLSLPEIQRHVMELSEYCTKIEENSQ